MTTDLPARAEAERIAELVAGLTISERVAMEHREPPMWLKVARPDLAKTVESGFSHDFMLLWTDDGHAVRAALKEMK